jgi:hypothetical protein
MHSHFCRTAPCGGSRRMGHPGGSAGLQAHWSGVLKIAPVAELDALSGAQWVGRSGRATVKRDKALLSAPRRTDPQCEGERGKPDRGVREMPLPRRLPRDSAGAWDRSVAATVKIETQENGSTSPRLLAAMVRWGSRDCRAVQRLSTQVVRKTGESNFVGDDCAICMQSRHQRLPRV